MTIVMIWELTYRIINFPSPQKVIEKLLILMDNNRLLTAISTSIGRIVFGYIISLVIGLFLGVVMARFTTIGSSLSKLMAAFQTMPNVCWVPFGILWFGVNEKAILFVIIIGSVFAVAMSTEAGIKNLNPTYLRVATMTGAKGYMLYKNVIIPGAVPVILSGLRQGWAFAWRGLIAGEMISSMNGLGQILSEGKKYSDINQIVAIMFVIIILGLLFDKIVFENIQKTIDYKFGIGGR